MQTSSTARFARIPLAVVVVLVAGMAGGLGVLTVTENLPGQGGSSSRTTPAPAVLPLTDEGTVSPRHIEGVLGPGATLDTEIKDPPVFGPADGLISPIAERGGALVSTSIGDRADAIGELGKPSADEYVARSHQAGGGNQGSADDSSPRETAFILDPHRGGITD